MHTSQRGSRPPFLRQLDRPSLQLLHVSTQLGHHVVELAFGVGRQAGAHDVGRHGKELCGRQVRRRLGGRGQAAGLWWLEKGVGADGGGRSRVVCLCLGSGGSGGGGPGLQLLLESRLDGRRKHGGGHGDADDGEEADA